MEQIAINGTNCGELTWPAATPRADRPQHRKLDLVEHGDADQEKILTFPHIESLFQATQCALLCSLPSSYVFQIYQTSINHSKRIFKA